jgi:hypothetical protein
MKSTQRFWLAKSSSPFSVKGVGTTGKTPLNRPGRLLEEFMSILFRVEEKACY